MRQEARPSLPALTSLRFLAALWVATFHMFVMQAFVGPVWFQRIAAFGYMGVNFFFVLSGFILVYSYWGKQVSPRVFWQTRFARVYPVFVFSLLLAAPFFFYACLKLDSSTVVPEWAWCAQHLKLSSLLTIFLLQTWTPQTSMAWHMPTWSISNEAFFYFLFPFVLPIFGRFSRKQLFVVVLGAIAVGIAITGVYNSLRPDGALTLDPRHVVPWRYFISFNPVSRLSEFLVGMASGLLFLRIKNHRQFAWPLVVAGVVAATFAATAMRYRPEIIVHPALLAPAFAAIIYGIALRPVGILAFVENRFSVLLGDASYSFYLLHSLIIGWYIPYFHDSVGSLRHQSWLSYFLVIGTICTLSIVTYLLIEQPLRRRLRPKSSAQRAPLLTSSVAAADNVS
jgi:peptidoglycan/LPS O-acetylase OafA/YrhL